MHDDSSEVNQSETAVSQVSDICIHNFYRKKVFHLVHYSSYIICWKRYVRAKTPWSVIWKATNRSNINKQWMCTIRWFNFGGTRKILKSPTFLFLLLKHLIMDLWSILVHGCSNLYMFKQKNWRTAANNLFVYRRSETWDITNCTHTIICKNQFQKIMKLLFATWWFTI